MLQYRLANNTETVPNYEFSVARRYVWCALTSTPQADLGGFVWRGATFGTDRRYLWDTKLEILWRAATFWTD
jgi:hypothetical protein